MAHQSIFCNVPWTNVHIYWDGSFGACCSESHKPYSSGSYNLRDMTVQDWYNAPPMQALRKNIQGSNQLSLCNRCYHQENNGYESRRIKENFKSVIFTKQAFDKSFQQSPWYNRFVSALDTANQSAPIDWHVDIGNECNLACKMCNPSASSLIASKYKKWNIATDTQKNWVNDPNSWNNFIASVDATPINRLHVMGGEPMLSKKFKELVDHLIKTNRTDMSISFVTNGTIQDQEFIDKLKTFRSFDIEISIESFENNNHYIRQAIGESTAPTIKHIQSLISQQTDTFHVVLRSVPQLLSINTYDQYIKWAWDSKVAIQGIPLIAPHYLAINVLPCELKQQLIQKFVKVKEYIQQSPQTSFNTLVTGRDVSRLDLQLIDECNAMISLLNQSEPSNVKDLRVQLSQWLMQWDKEFNLNAYEFYPEYAEFLNEIQYRI